MALRSTPRHQAAAGHRCRGSHAAVHGRTLLSGSGPWRVAPRCARKSPLVAQASASTSAPTAQPILRKAKTPEELNDPAQIGATGSSSARFPIPPNNESLDNYMLLPVEQYFVLDPKQILHLGGNRFQLIPPRISLFNLWIEAKVDVVVVTHRGGPSSPPRVALQAENCTISGSELVERLALDQRFSLRFTTDLTWKTQQLHGPGGDSKQGEMFADSKLDVWCEVVPPFHLVPRDVLIGTCNGVMHGLMSSLLPLFTRMLATDYERWAADPAYRAERAQRSKPLV